MIKDEKEGGMRGIKNARFRGGKRARGGEICRNKKAGFRVGGFPYESLLKGSSMIFTRRHRAERTQRRRYLLLFSSLPLASCMIRSE